MCDCIVFARCQTLVCASPGLTIGRPVSAETASIPAATSFRRDYEQVRKSWRSGISGAPSASTPNLLSSMGGSARALMSHGSMTVQNWRSAKEISATRRESWFRGLTQRPSSTYQKSSSSITSVCSSSSMLYGNKQASGIFQRTSSVPVTAAEEDLASKRLIDSDLEAKFGVWTGTRRAARSKMLSPLCASAPSRRSDQADARVRRSARLNGGGKAEFDNVNSPRETCASDSSLFWKRYTRLILSAELRGINARELHQ